MIRNFAFTKLIVGDIAGLERFYCEALGLRVANRIEIDNGAWNLVETILAVGESAAPLLNLIHYPGRPVPPAGEAVIGFNVTDLDAVIAAAVAGGGSLAVPPVAVPEHGLRLAYVADPEGHTIELLQYD